MPTLAGLLDIPRPSHVKGYDLSEAVLDPANDKPIQTSLLFTFDDVRAGNKSAPASVTASDRIRCVHTRDWKYSRYFHAAGSYLEEYELYYIRGIADNETYPGDDPNDPLGMALKGQPYECVNLAYTDNPDFINLPQAAQEQVLKAHAEMKELLKNRELDMLTGREIALRKQADKVREAQGTASN